MAVGGVSFTSCCLLQGNSVMKILASKLLSLNPDILFIGKSLNRASIVRDLRARVWPPPDGGLEIGSPANGCCGDVREEPCFGAHCADDRCEDVHVGVSCRQGASLATLSLLKFF